MDEFQYYVDQISAQVYLFVSDRMLSHSYPYRFIEPPQRYCEMCRLDRQTDRAGRLLVREALGQFLSKTFRQAVRWAVSKSGSH